MTQSVNQHSPMGRREAQGSLGALLRRVLRGSSEESGWYVRTGETRAVTAGSEYINGVNVASVLGDKFEAAVDAVIAVNGRNCSNDAERFQAVRSQFRANLTRDQR